MRRLGLIFLVSAIPYIALSPWRPYPLSWAIKLLPLLVLVLWARGKGMPRLWWVGLLASAAGDIFMDLDRRIYLEAGIAAFSVGYILYAIEFWKTVRPTGVAVARAAALVVYVIGFAAVIIPGAGGMRGPVVVYALVLAHLGVAASLGLPGWLGFVGVCSLIFSDTLIGLDLFGAGIHAPRALVIGTYYFGQYGVAKALEARRHGR